MGRIETLRRVMGAIISQVTYVRSHMDVSLLADHLHHIGTLGVGGLRITHIQYPLCGESVSITIVALKFIQFETGDHRQQRARRLSPAQPAFFVILILMAMTLRRGAGGAARSRLRHC